MCKGCEMGAYGLPSLSEKNRKSNHLQTSSTPQLLKEPGCWSGQDLNQRPPAQQTSTYPIELTGWWLIAL